MVICKKSENGYSWVDPDNGPLSESILGSCSVDGSPDVVKPDDGKPDLGNSGDDKPNWGNWDKDKPDLDNSDDTKPDSGNWDEDKPDWSTPADDKPDDNKPDGGSWDWDKSDEDRPDSDNSDGDKTDGWSIWDWSIWNWGDSDKDKQDWDNSVEDKPDDGKQDWTNWDWGNSDKDKADWEKPADWEDGKWNDGKWGDEDWEKPKDESEVETKPAAECPLIETDPNEAATGPKCDIYHGYHICKRDCNEGFRPIQPIAVYCKETDDGNVWATKLGEAILGGCEEKKVSEWTEVSECPAIESDPNEAATGPKCDDYFCGRDCNEGFKPSHPTKVFCKKSDDGNYWATYKGEASLGSCIESTGNGGPDNGGSPSWGDESEGEKTDVSECPAIETGPNEATGPKCDDYFCERDCNEGFIPTHPLKVFCKTSDDGNYWATYRGEASLGSCIEKTGPDNGESGNDGPGNGGPGSGGPGNGGPGNGGPGNGGPGNGGPGNGGPGNGGPGNGGPGNGGTGNGVSGFPDKPADCKCRKFPLKPWIIKTGIQYEYSKNDKGQYVATFSCPESDKPIFLAIGRKIHSADTLSTTCMCKRKGRKCGWKNKSKKNSKYKKWVCRYANLKPAKPTKVGSY